MKLTLAIPVHNDRRYLERLLNRCRELECADHIVIVDDGSDEPLQADQIARATGFLPRQVTLLRNPRARGPGVARNQALTRVNTSHILYVDADDLPTPELPHMLRDLHDEQFDFCIFQHHDTRVVHPQVWGQVWFDQRHWRAAGTDVGALTQVSESAASHLSQTANYPWNKIYRTEFLRKNKIGCSNLMVHEDIELHWRSFLCASRILASDRIATIHFVNEASGNRLTNRMGAERLDVFGPLRLIANEINQGNAGGYTLAFHRFVFGLFDWISHNLEPDLLWSLSDLIREFQNDYLPPETRKQIDRQNPDLAERIDFLLRTGTPP